MGRINEREAEVDGWFRAEVAATRPGAARPQQESLTPGSRLTGTQGLELFEAQATSRQLDLAARQLAREGRGYYSIGSSGHEGNAAVAAALRVDDPALLHYRSGAFFVQRARRVAGLDPIRDVLLGVVAAVADPISGGRHKVFGSKAANIIPQTSTIASHLPRAVGLAFALERAMQLKVACEWPSDAVVVCSFGDASANHSTAVGAINTAVHTAQLGVPMPLLFVCEDNGIGISVPTPRGWIEQAYGARPGLRWFDTDGSDLAETFATAQEAANWVRAHRKPAFLRMRTVRLLGHAGSDVETAYRRPADLASDLHGDPVTRTARLLITAGFATPGEILRRYSDIGARVTATAESVWGEAKLTSASAIMAPIAPSRPSVVRTDALRTSGTASAIPGSAAVNATGTAAAISTGAVATNSTSSVTLGSSGSVTIGSTGSGTGGSTGSGGGGLTGSVTVGTTGSGTVGSTGSTTHGSTRSTGGGLTGPAPGSSPGSTSVGSSGSGAGGLTRSAPGSSSRSAPVGSSGPDAGGLTGSVAIGSGSGAAGSTGSGGGALTGSVPVGATGSGGRTGSSAVDRGESGVGGSAVSGSARSAASASGSPRAIAPKYAAAGQPVSGANSASAAGTPMTLAQAVNHTLGQLLSRDADVLVFGEDVGRKGGVYGVTKGLQQTFGVRRVFDTLLDEQSVLGTALGSALAGFVPIPEIQYLAYVHNAEDQLRGEAATLSFFSNGQYRNPLVVRIAGYAYQKGFGGHFHNDNSIAALRDIPGLVIATPSRADDAAAMLRTCVSAARVDGRVCVYLEPIALYHTRDLHRPGDGGWLAPADAVRHIEIGQARVHGTGTHLTIVSFANGVPMSLRVARRLAERGVHARVVDLRWLAPLPVDDLLDNARATGRVLIADETRRSGGVSEAVCTALLDAGFDGRIARVTSEDSFIPLGPAANSVLLDEDRIEAAADKLLAAL
ncbi:thiamine pyrophosphate-dependent enzyme [Nocardia acidivorans]|uniref:thiamine pyrophosphate-dependent enzyme n=1 Tax=Nocardia acidivorans TaxID=404580 RepID=UPI0035A21BB8